MDTRSKILDRPEAERILTDSAGKLVVGYFDPLLAEHARRLGEIAGAGRLFVIVTSPAKPLLPAQTRAELVAALEAVEHVVVAPAARLQTLLRLAGPERLVLEQAHDAERTLELMRHVHARQKA